MNRFEHILLLSVPVFFTLVYFAPKVEGIGCFVCSSVNNSTPECEDTFNNSKNYYRTNCKAGRKRRNGLFPATDCVKLKGTIVKTQVTILVRACVVDNGGINTETEIGRSNHCGLMSYMRFNNEDMQGCVLSCGTDGCNSAKTNRGTHFIIYISFVIGLLPSGRILNFSVT